MLKCILCLKYSWENNNPLCTKCAGRVQIPSVTRQMRRALEKLSKVTLDEIWQSINKRILAFEHYDLIHHFNSERIFAEYLSLVEVQKRTGDKIDYDIINDENRWRALSYALTYESEDVRPKRESVQERRIEPYRESDDQYVELDEVTPAYLKDVKLEDYDENEGTTGSD